LSIFQSELKKDIHSKIGFQTKKFLPKHHPLSGIVVGHMTSKSHILGKVLPKHRPLSDGSFDNCRRQSVKGRVAAP